MKIKKGDQIEFRDAGLYSDKIEELYAFVTCDEKGEGVMATLNPHNFICLYILNNAEKDKLGLFKNNAKIAGQRANKTVKLIKFLRTDDVEVIYKSKD